MIECNLPPVPFEEMFCSEKFSRSSKTSISITEDKRVIINDKHFGYVERQIDEKLLVVTESYNKYLDRLATMKNVGYWTGDFNDIKEIVELNL